MGQLLLVLVVAVTVAAVVFGVTVLVTGGDPGLTPVEPDGRAVPLPGDRPLRESDIATIRFDTALRGYRMVQVDQALRRAAYDIGYKDELIGVLEAEVAALRNGSVAEADALRRAREAAVAPQGQPPAGPPTANPPTADPRPAPVESGPPPVGPVESGPGAPGRADPLAEPVRPGSGSISGTPDPLGPGRSDESTAVRTEQS